MSEPNLSGPPPIPPCPFELESEPLPAPRTPPSADDAGRTLNTWYKGKSLNFPPEFEGWPPPASITEPTVYGHLPVPRKDRSGHPMRTKDGDVIMDNGVLHLPGVGHKTKGGVMFVSPSVLWEELDAPPWNPKRIMLKGPHGSLFRRTLIRAGFDEKDWYYTCVVKYYASNLAPRTPDIQWGLPALEAEIAEMRPRLIVCMGKSVFDIFHYPSRCKLADAYGIFFWSKRYETQYYVMDHILKPVLRPEHLERYEIDIKNVHEEYELAKSGKDRVEVSTTFHQINTSEELGNLLSNVTGQGFNDLAVDCEWHGRTWLTGNLRAFQLCWTPGHAAYVRLMDDKLNFVFDGNNINTRYDNGEMLILDHELKSVREAAALLNDKKIRFIGHNASADMPWLDHKLKIDVYRKFRFDTMYALHTVNECADLGLERLAMRYTTFGRYDKDLIAWKKSVGWDEDDNEGYGLVPDSVLIPYASLDVNVTLISWFKLLDALAWEGLGQYYQEFVLPFVTDGFYEMTGSGLPVDVPYLEEMRMVFKRNLGVLLENFRAQAFRECHENLRAAMVAMANPAQLRNDPQEMYNRTCEAMAAFSEIDMLLKLVTHPATGKIDRSMTEVHKAFDVLRAFASKRCNGNDWEDLRQRFWFMLDAQEFNIDATDQIRRWMFIVKQLDPIRATKREGFQLAWDKVHPQERDKWRTAHDPGKNRNIYVPAADKPTIKVYSYVNPSVAQLQELKTTATIVKSFLGDNQSEGVQKWLQSDKRIHANFALTETARPRAWKPNILNWPKSVTKPIEQAFDRVHKIQPVWREVVDGQLKEFKNEDRPSSLRSCITAPPGWAIIDMDLKTAEVMALAYISGDENMIKVLTEDDKQFVLSVEKDSKGKHKTLRVCYNENSPYGQEARDPSLLVNLEDPRILRKENDVLFPRRDLHWEMGETVALKPRELLDDRMIRDGVGKVGNFSIPYGTGPASLERLIEASTGRRPDPGTGEKMIAAWEERYPIAAKFQYAMEMRLLDPGWWRSPSGRIRHFYFDTIQDIFSHKYTAAKWRIMSPITREARNFPCQELVAATTGHAILDFIQRRREMSLRARVGILLYDAVTVFSPLEELKATAQLLKNCLTIWRPWTINGRTFNFEVDVSYGFRWGVKPSETEKETLNQYL